MSIGRSWWGWRWAGADAEAGKPSSLRMGNASVKNFLNEGMKKILKVVENDFFFLERKFLNNVFFSLILS